MGVMDDYVKKQEAASPSSAVDRVYTLDDKTTALIYLARYHGRASMAQTALKEERDLDVPVRTLHDWKSGEDFEHVARMYAQRLEDELIREARENAHAAAAVERQALAKLETIIDSQSLRVGDLAAAINAATSTKVKNIDKVLAMTGRPQVITESRDFSHIVEGLVQRGILRAETDPIEDAEIVDDPGT
jgi:hypothetical protein